MAVSVSWPTVVCNQCVCVGGGRVDTVDWRGEGAADFSQYEMRPGLRLVSVLLVPHQISLYLNLSTNYLVCSEDAFFSKHSFLSAVLKH